MLILDWPFAISNSTEMHPLFMPSYNLLLRFCILGAIVGLGQLCTNSLQAETPSIEYVEAPALMRGTTAELKIVGANLHSDCELVFYEPGLVCQAIDTDGDEGLRVTLGATDDCKTGVHAFRIRGRGGYSELRTLAVTPYPVIKGLRTDEEVPLGRSLVGKLSDEVTNRFSVILPADSRLSVDIEAIRLGIDMLDAEVVIRDPHGMIIAQADDSNLYRQDPIVSTVAKIQGRYTIEVYDAGRNAGELAYFVMHVSNGPRPSAVFPLGGPPGATLALTFTGDGRGSWTTTQRLPELDRSQFDSFQLFAEQDGQRSATALPFRLSPLVNKVENLDNDSFDVLPLPQEVELELAINGRLEKPLDRDCFWVRGVAGQNLEIQVFAQRLGSAADTLLTVVDSRQHIIAGSDDIDSLDSRVDLVVPADGLFGIVIEEKRGKGGDGFAYRIEIIRGQSTAEAFLPRRDRLSQDMQTVSIPVGNRVLALMGVRKDDATGETYLRFPDLPEGVTASFSQPRSNQPIVPVVFEAAAGTGLVGQLVPVDVSVRSATATVTGHFQQVTDLVRGPADAVYAEHKATRLALCTRESYPVRVSVVQPKAALAQDGTLDIEVSVERQAGVAGDVVLTLPWLPAWVDAEPSVVVPEGQTQAVIRLRAWPKAEQGLWPLVVEASLDASGRRRRLAGTGAPSAVGSDSPTPTVFPNAVASQVVELQVVEAPALGRFDLASAEQGETFTLPCELTVSPQLQAVADLVATLEGLPNRVQCDPVPITPTAQVIPFRVRLSETAPVGRASGWLCRLSGKLDGESVSYVIARNGVISIEPPGQIVRDENGRPLNRIDALRKKSSLTNN